MSELKADHVHGRIDDCDGCKWTRFRKAVEASWSAATSADPDWSSSNPALGQCAVTALVVQDYYGGVLARTTVGGVSHYFNRLPNKGEVDLTRSQFPSWEPTPVEERSRDYVLSFEPTRKRYELLEAAISAKLGEQR